MPIDLVWEDDRIDHIARHGVDIEEVLEVLARRNFRRKAHKDADRVIGQTDSGRFLTLFIGHREGRFYGLITARDATRNERREWERHGIRRVR